MNRKTFVVASPTGLLLARGLQAQPDDDQAAIERVGFNGVPPGPGAPQVAGAWEQ
jgi:invasion protein IalB